MVFVVVCFYISENINGKNKAHVKQFTIIHGTKPKVYMPTRRSSGQHTKVNSDDTSKSRLKLHTFFVIIVVNYYFILFTFYHEITANTVATPYVQVNAIYK